MSTSTKLTFDDLPDDVLYRIGLYLNRDDLFNMMLTCKYNKIIFSNDSIWSNILLKDYPTSKNTGKEGYKEIHTTRVWVFGNNTESILGLGDCLSRNIPTLMPKIRVDKISCGERHTVMRDYFGNLWGFGANECYQLGFEYKSIYSTPTFMNFQVKDFSCGLFHTVILNMDDQAMGFGQNHNFQLTYDINKQITLPIYLHKFDVKITRVKCCMESTYLTTTTGREIRFGIPFKFILNNYINWLQCDKVSSIVIYKDNSVKCQGENIKHKLGLPRIQNYDLRKLPNIKAKYVSSGYFHTFFIDVQDHVLVCGSGHNGQLGFNTCKHIEKPIQINNIKARKICCKNNFSMILDFEGNLWVMGENMFGQLGIGVNYDVRDMRKLQGFEVKNVKCLDNATIIIARKI